MEKRKNTLYWQCEYQSYSGWKTKFLFTDDIGIYNYIQRYLQNKKYEINNLSIGEVNILEKMVKIKWQVVKL